MRITLFSHGSRGDVWPMVALGWHLMQSEHDVTVAVPGEFVEFTERMGLRASPMPFDVTAWMNAGHGQHMLHKGGPRFMRAMTREYESRADAFDEACLAAAEGAEALVGSLMLADRVWALGELRRLPVAMVYQLPVSPSSEYASLLMTKGKLLQSRTLNRVSHELTELAWRFGSGRATIDFRRKIGLPAKRVATFRLMEEQRCLGLHTVSPSVFPRPTDWAEHLKLTGAWQMPSVTRGELGEQLPADLEEWLCAGEAPIFLGFGSMPVLDPEPLYQDILAVTSILRRRAVLSANCVPPRALHALPEHLRIVGAVDHDRLFPRCVAVVHHGGVGSIMTSLRAGRPTLVCSVIADQPWWGQRLRKLGVGAHVPFAKLNRDKLSAALRMLLDPAVAERARRLGDRIEAEGDGLPRASRLLEEWLGSASVSVPA
ncbi:MAG TPA: glycosyltransferase [Solirubrobacteraceae bacterium]|jgi:sterol 3beta-glucosyltransferase